MTDLPGCPSDKQYQMFLSDSLQGDSRLDIERHVDECETCQSRLAEMSSRPDWMRWMPADGNVPISEVPEQLRTIDRYEVIREIGRGGMGIVYLARDPDLGRQVAIKLLARERCHETQWLNRFRREARLAGALNHPNVLTIYETGETNGMPYIATEFVEGITLRKRLSRSPLLLTEALGYAVQLIDGLTVAHAAGVIHRDLKPDNIMIRDDSRLKILDFGLARVRQNETSAVSDPGLVLGTVSYMSPEQARGQELDTSSDVFSFGTLLFLMLTSQRPFDGQTPSDIMAAILTRAPRPLADCGVELPSELSRLLLACLAKDPAHRPAARDILKILQQQLDESRSDVVPGTTATRTSTGESTTESATPAPATGAELQPGTIRYARSGDVNIAWQTIGTGPIDLVFVMGWVSHLEWFWREPSFAAFLRRLASFSRVILFDKRGTGLSDRVPVNELPTLETRMDDVRAVMDAAGSDRAVLCGVSEGGPLCTLFAATYPDKTIAITMMGCYARRLWAEDYPWGPTAEQREVFLEDIGKNWGGPLGIEDRAPSKSADPEFRQWWASYLRMGASPGAAVALTRMNARIDVRPILRTIQVPTLVIHRSGDRCLLVDEGRHIAELIPGAKFVELPGDDHLPFVGDADLILDEIEEFLTGKRHAPAFDRVLATVLCIAVEPPGNTTPEGDRVMQFQTLVGREAELFRGRMLSPTTAELLLTFDGPARAVRAGAAVTGLAQRLDLSIRCGIDTGSCDISHETATGPAVERARRIATAAAFGDIRVSASLRSLVSGSGLDFVDAGAIPTVTEQEDCRTYGLVR